MQPKQFRNLMESARSIVHPIVENGDHECKDCPKHKHGHENEDSGHHEIKHKGKSCKEAHPDMEHEEWEMSQNEGRSFFKSTPDEYKKKAKAVLDKTKVHTVKTKSGTEEKVSGDDLQAAGDLYDRLKKREDVDYELQDSTKESLARFIGEKVVTGKDGVKRLKGAFKSEPPFHGMSQKAWDAAKAKREKEAKGKPKQQNNSVEHDGDDIQELSKTTLGSYVRGAAKDTGDQAYGAGQNIEKVRERGRYDDATAPAKAHDKQVAKVKSRARGISKAVRKLAAGVEHDGDDIQEYKKTTSQKVGGKEDLAHIAAHNEKRRKAGTYPKPRPVEKTRAEIMRDQPTRDSKGNKITRLGDHVEHDGEDMQELKTSTLQNYVKKSIYKGRGADPNLGRKQRSSMMKAVDRLATRKTRMYQGNERGSEIK